MSKLILIVVKLVSRSPFWIIYLLADFLSKIMLRIFPYRKNVIDKNLKMVFPKKSRKEITKMRRKFYSFFAKFILESLKQLTISPDELRKRITFTGYEEIDALIAQGQSVLVITYHYSNFEWAFVGYSAHAKQPLNGIYKPMSSEVFGKAVIESRSRFGATMTPMKETYNYMNDNINENAFVLGLIPDQSPGSMKGHWMNFLGRGTPVYRGPENLAKKFNLPVFTIDVEPIKLGYYKAHVELLTKRPLEEENGWITEEFMKRLEKKILQRPEQYLWSHKRWKRSKLKEVPENQISKRYPPPFEDIIDY